MKTVSVESQQTGREWGLLRLFVSTRKRLPEPGRLAPSPAGEPAAAPNGKKILIVDDDLVIRATTSFKLKSKGYVVTTALDCSEALAMVRDDCPDLILLDIMFPPDVAHGGGVAWDGFLIMSWLRQFREGRNIPIIIITGLDTEQLQERALKEGARAFFHKPIDHDGLLAVIARTLGEDTEEAPSDFESGFQI
jgi:CheY-like chemotaxis protein